MSSLVIYWFWNAIYTAIVQLHVCSHKLKDVVFRFSNGKIYGMAMDNTTLVGLMIF